MDSKLATAFFLGEHRIYGYSLKPFCLLHSLQLEAIESPLAFGFEASKTDLVVAAQICASHRALTTYKRHTWRRLRYSHEAEAAKFGTYLAESRSCFDLYDQPESGCGGSLRAPWQMVVVTYLIRNTTISWREAWTMPMGQALCAFYATQEQETGKSCIYSDDEKAAYAEFQADKESGLHDLQLARFEEYQRRRKAGTWPAGKIFNHDEELPPEGEN